MDKPREKQQTPDSWLPIPDSCPSFPPHFSEFQEFSETAPNLHAEPNVLAASAGLARPGRHRRRVFHLTCPPMRGKLT